MKCKQLHPEISGFADCQQLRYDRQGIGLVVLTSCAVLQQKQIRMLSSDAD
jgi:hypothetical protein